MSWDKHMERVLKEESSASNSTRSLPEVSSSNSREANRRSESFCASSSRNNGHTFKRSAIPSNGVHENGLHKAQYSRKGDWVRLVLRSRITKPSATEKGSRSLRRAWFCGAALVIGVCFFVYEAFVQGSASLLVKGTAAVAAEALTMKHFPDVSSMALSSELVVEYKVKFVPRKLNDQFVKQRFALDKLRKLPRNSFRRPRLALVCVDLEATPDTLYLITLWKALELLGYELEVFSKNGGPMQYAWEKSGAFVTVLQRDFFQFGGLCVDWLKFEGVLLSSLNAKDVMASFLQDPFKEVSVIWILHEDLEGNDPWSHGLASNNELLSRDRRIFERANVVLLSDYVLAMTYSRFDTGNFFVLPGSPINEWKAEKFMSMHSRGKVRDGLNLGTNDIAVAVVGSPFSYRSVWREHAIVMQAILPIAQMYRKEKGGFSMKLLFWSGGLPSSYDRTLQILAMQIGFTNGTVSHYGSDSDLDELLWAADIIVYSSLREEQAFPSMLLRAMVFEHPIVAPNITVIKDEMQGGVYGYLFKAGDKNDLARAFEKSLSRFCATGQGHAVELHSLRHGQGLLVAKVISGFADLLEAVIEFPSEVHLPLPISSLSRSFQKDWQRQLLEVSNGLAGGNYVEGQKSWTNPLVAHQNERSLSKPDSKDKNLASQSENQDELSLADWLEFKEMKLEEETDQSEEEQLKERNEQLHGTWEEVYRSVRKKENMKNELHEREDGELERTGQPICIYEPYTGVGAWPLLGQKSMMYRGISLISKQRRPGSDDIDAPLRLPLLNISYYQDVLCEFGAFFAIANRVDRIHKNAWIGFQSWQAAGRKVSLSGKAESLLLDAVKGGNNGDTVYFWASTDSITYKKLMQGDFWSYCDTINNGNCRHVFLRTFKKMYALPSDWNMLPPMPMGRDCWSILHSWAMPTRSFMEFIMFSRMFVSTLDSFHTQHRDKCSLGSSTFEARHCYCRLLELLVNVWAYHSGHRMIYVDPDTGAMNEQHRLSSRHGHMWTSFFSYETLKDMDGDLAEEADDETSADKNWLWPRTGEVFCQKIYERERKQRYAMKLEKKKRDKERVRRIRGRQRQRPLSRG